MSVEMTSNKPYLVKAFYDWISDNQLTPYVVVDVSVYGVMVPEAYVNNGQIVLNVSGGAVGAISLGDQLLEFSARFGGKLEHIVIPYGAIAAIYAKENGVGTALEIEHVDPKAEGNETVDDKPSGLSLATEEPVDSSAEKPAASDKKDKPKGKPSLKVVK